ncbi:unnamed protein product, partial [Rotaria sp. Silwood1]
PPPPFDKVYKYPPICFG